MPEPILEVLDGGLLTTVQDAGRPDWRHLGVPGSGAADPWGLAVTNLLVGNAMDAAILEATVAGPTLRVIRPTTIGLAGADLGGRIRGGRRLVPGRSHRLGVGDIVELPGAPGARDGARVCLSVPGGFEVPVVLGSRSTCLSAAFGGFEGRPLRAGDRLAAADDRLPPELAWPIADSERTAEALLRVVPVPGSDLGPLLGPVWRVAPSSDRVGVRLEGPSLPEGVGGETDSQGVVWGAIQVPPDGRPIILGPDHQTTGGYRVAGVVITADRPVLGQLAPGATVRLIQTDRPAAVDALRAQREALLAGVSAMRDAGSWDALAESAGAWAAARPATSDRHRQHEESST